MKTILNTIPDFVKSGLKVATGMLPALGFAILIRMMLTKNVAVFFLLGFILASYLKLPILAIAILDGILAFLLAFTKDNNN